MQSSISQEIRRSINLLKKSYSSAVSFHLIFCHIVFLLEKEPKFFPKTDWEILTILATSSKTSKIYQKNFQNSVNKNKFDQKILNFLKSYNKEIRTNNIFTFKLKMILYYCVNQENFDVNNFLFFELTNFYGISDEINFLICKLNVNFKLSDVFGNKNNPKINENIFSNFIKKDLTEKTKIQLIPAIYDVENVKNYKIKEFNVKNKILLIKILENFVFYAKFTKNPSSFKEIFSEDKEFIVIFRNYIKNNINEEILSEKILYDKVFSERIDIYNILESKYKISADKNKFLDEVKRFLKFK